MQKISTLISKHAPTIWKFIFKSLTKLIEKQHKQHLEAGEPDIEIAKGCEQIENQEIVKKPNFVFQKPKRKVHSVFIHCSDSDVAGHDDVSVIDRWHQERGFDGVGYHFFIQKSGNIQKGRDLEKIPASQFGFNTNTIAICLHGRHAFTQEQFNSLQDLCVQIHNVYKQTALSGAQIRFRGHCEVDNFKTCPNFDYKAVLHLDKDGFLKNEV